MESENKLGRYSLIVIASHSCDICTRLTIDNWDHRLRDRSRFTTSFWKTIAHSRKHTLPLLLQHQLVYQISHLTTRKITYWRKSILRKDRIIVDKIYKWLIPLYSLSLHYSHREPSQSDLESLSDCHFLIRFKCIIRISSYEIIFFCITNIPSIPLIIDIFKASCVEGSVSLSSCHPLKYNLHQLRTSNISIWSIRPIWVSFYNSALSNILDTPRILICSNIRKLCTNDNWHPKQ
jgi:hypothetical protein